MMKKKETYTIITPIPSCVPRQLALDILHSHGEIITLNPLVLSYQPIKAPRDAPADEYYSTWYEITERVQYIPGLGKMGSGKISFKGCFHNVAWGLHTHTYVPLGIDLLNKYHIEGNQPDEPLDLRDRPSGAPDSGLYLREVVKISCNITMMSFVKNQLKAASKILVDRLIKKAELLDAGVLQAMMENGKLKTFNPADRSSENQMQASQMPLDQMSLPRSSSTSTRRESMSASSQMNYNYYQPQYAQESSQNTAVELPGNYYQQNLQRTGSEKYQELPDMDRRRYTSPGGLHTRSYSNSDTSSIPPLNSPQFNKNFVAELPAFKENVDEQTGVRKDVHELFVPHS
ncbi:hypothetical protein N7462_011347 [Penicillium macrosclerotiorum]|uniref:uncharacterized protein n=1 Tax=Penicillium macrosclerotiorum TaxID=303699 RepID=UPI002546D24B|nr:uncharacterized protein N7462_011347 [Penicillium macrosclerotiorum]KAJ5666938.1 hypothetical protein N7462_011347 [Penicillium macrosclerotiorum]